MPDPHLWMFVAPFLAAIWWTRQWLLTRLVSRWRFVIGGLLGTLLWVYCAYASTRVLVADGGTTVTFGSTSLAYFCVVMAIVSFVGIPIGLLEWTEEEGEEVREEVPNSRIPGVGD